MFHTPDVLKRWGSIDLYREHGLDAWHGRYNQGAVKCPGATEVQRAAFFIRWMCLKRKAEAEVLARCAVRRRPSAAGVHKATKADDRRTRENKPQVHESAAEAVKVAKKRKKLAAGVVLDEASTVRVYWHATVGSTREEEQSRVFFEIAIGFSEPVVADRLKHQLRP